MPEATSPPREPGEPVPPAQSLPPSTKEDDWGFLFDWGLNILCLLIAGLLLWKRHWILWVLGGLAVMMLLIRLIWKIRSMFSREKLRRGNLKRPKGTPSGRKLSKGPIDDWPGHGLSL
jgi:uncharacterized membrane protein